MKKRSILLLLFAFCLLAGKAQDISVKSFELLPNDLTANNNGTMENDQNGEVAALIKVITSEKGFVFDGGMMGIVKVVQKVGEIWVYVPHGINHISISHQQLGKLRIGLGCGGNRFRGLFFGFGLVIRVAKQCIDLFRFPLGGRFFNC